MNWFYTHQNQAVNLNTVRRVTFHSDPADRVFARLFFAPVIGEDEPRMLLGKTDADRLDAELRAYSTEI